VASDPWEVLESRYLESADERAGSGFRGDAARWERARRVIVRAIDSDGTFLDIGCANGLLMASVAAWAREDGHVVEPFGIDVSAKLAALARERLPEWSDRIHVGDARTWEPSPGMRFDFVRTELEYAGRAERPALVAHLLERVAAKDGRVIVCGYGAASAGLETVEDVAGELRSMGFDIAGEAEARDANGVRFTRIAWMDGPDRSGTGDQR
jgi:SAM-dependent methyltransferase